MTDFTLITGATSGFGRATATLLAKQGRSLIITGRRKDRLEELSQNLKNNYNVEVFTWCFDLMKKEEIKNCLDQNKNILPQVSTLINNAGLAAGTDKVHEADIEDWERMIDTNVKGLFYLTRQILPHMVAQKNGDIVNIGSVAGCWTYPGGSVYCASKAAVKAFSEGLRMDLLGQGIRVMNIEPGLAETEFSLTRLGSQEKSDQVYQGMKPLTAEDIAETVVWTLNRPKHVNIQEMVVFPTDQASVHHVHRQT